MYKVAIEDVNDWALELLPEWSSRESERQAREAQEQAEAELVLGRE